MTDQDPNTTTSPEAHAADAPHISPDVTAHAAPPGAAETTELVDESIKLATPVFEDVALSMRDKLITEGHALIERHLTAAKRLADLQPAVRLLLPVIAACLHDLFSHLTTDPKQAEQEAARKPAQ